MLGPDIGGEDATLLPKKPKVLVADRVEVSGLGASSLTRTDLGEQLNWDILGSKDCDCSLDYCVLPARRQARDNDQAKAW